MGGILSAKEINVVINFNDEDEFPTSIRDTKSANWNPESPITSFAPILGFASSGAMEVSFNLRFSIEEGSTMRRVHICRALVVPDYEKNLYRPPQVTLTIENYLDQFKGVVESITVAIAEEAVWVGGEPSVVDVTFSIKECDTEMQTQVYGPSYSPRTEST